MANDADRQLVDLVVRQIRAGYRHLVLPGSLCAQTTPEGRDAVAELCRVNGVTYEIETSW